VDNFRTTGYRISFVVVSNEKNETVFDENTTSPSLDTISISNTK